MSDTKNYLASFKASKKDGVWHGIKGQRWGVRRSRAQIDSAPSGPHPGATPKHGETSQERYSRIKTVVKDKKAHDLSNEDLNFFNARTDAINKINKLNETKPNWISDTTKKVLQEVAKQQVQQIANGSAKKYISGPVLDQINQN